MNHRTHQVLQLDIQGTPQAWITTEEAALHYATGTVAWEDGAGPLVTLRGGWNVARKAARTPEQAGMPLVYLPYVPNRFEDFLLAGRNIRTDVHEWLAARLTKGSRLN